jgi:hypothetical protein
MGPLVHMDSHSSISSIISAKMGGKNMVFVEAPATIEAESDAVGSGSTVLDAHQDHQHSFQGPAWHSSKETVLEGRMHM